MRPIFDQKSLAKQNPNFTQTRVPGSVLGSLYLCGIWGCLVPNLVPKKFGSFASLSKTPNQTKPKNPTLHRIICSPRGSNNNCRLAHVNQQVMGN